MRAEHVFVMVLTQIDRNLVETQARLKFCQIEAREEKKALLLINELFNYLVRFCKKTLICQTDHPFSERGKL